MGSEIAAGGDLIRKLIKALNEAEFQVDVRPLPRSIVDYLREARRRGYPVSTNLDD